jgi:hypothetical protein
VGTVGTPSTAGAVASGASIQPGEAFHREALTKSAETGKPVLFDLALAHELYVTLIGPVEAPVKNKRHLLVVPTGALTSLPFHLLVTEKPSTPVPALNDIAT